MNIDDDFICDVMETAARNICSFFGKSEVLQNKGHRDILLRADMRSHEYFVARLHEKYPQIPVVSEETYTRNAEKKSDCFILDPLDGTINFSRGIMEYGILLAFKKDGDIQKGWVYKPKTDEWFIAEKGKGSVRNGRPLQVSKTDQLKTAIIAVDFSRELERLPRYLSALHSHVRIVRSYGCAAHALGLLAQGQIDAYVYDTPKIWDIAAMECVIKEAGGLLFSAKGGGIWQGNGDPIVVCTPGIKKELLALLK